MLARGKLHLAGAQPFIIATAKATKNKKTARQFITRALADELQALVSRKVAGASAFNMPPDYQVSAMFYSDLAAARTAWPETFKDAQKRIEAAQGDFLKACDSQGERLDFHLLRHTCKPVG